MRRRICFVILLLSALSAIQPAWARQKGDALTGTWKGDWGPSPTDRNAVILELKWNEKTLTGAINPGPDAIPIDKGSFDANPGRSISKPRRRPPILFTSSMARSKTTR